MAGIKLLKSTVRFRLSSSLVRGLKLLSAIICLLSLYQVITMYRSDSDNRNTLTEAQQMYHEFSNKMEIRPINNGIQPVFQSLHEINPDMTGWLTAEGTLIDYPVVQAKDNDYYLTRNYTREEARAGSLFMDFRNDPGLVSKNTIIYGHRMKDGSMFGQLKLFLDRDFFEAHRTLLYSSLYDNYRLEVFSVYYTTTDFNYIQTDFACEDDYRAYLERIRQMSLFVTNIPVSVNDRIVTLSTCDYTLDPDEGRLVVHAKLVKL